MPGEATIGALRVVLGADTAKFEDNLKGALGSLADFGKKALQIATGINLANAFEQAFHGVIDSITGAIDAADKLAKASQKFGVPVETLSALSNAAALSDVSLEQLGSSLSKLSKNMISAQGPTSEQATAFAALGISIKDSTGQLKNADQILLAVADSFSKFRDGTTKTALAVALFGRAGADMIPFLDQGAKGIQDMTARMSELGIVINSDTAKAAETFNDDLKLLAQAQNALVLKIIGESGLLAALVQLAEAMLGGSKAATQFADVVTNKLGGALVEINKFVADINAGLSTFGAGGQTQSLLKALEDVGKTAAAAQAGGIDKLVEGVSSLEEAQKRLAAAPPAFDPEAAKKLKQFNDELTKIHDRALDISGVFAGQLAPGFLAATANMEALKGQITIVGDQFVRLGPLAQKFNEALLQLQGVQLTQQLLTPFAQFEQQMVTLDLLLAKNAINLDTYAKKAAINAANMQVAYATVFNNIATNAANAFKDLASVNHEFAAAAKVAAIAQATIATYLGAANAYAQAALIGGPVLAAVAAAVAVAAGLANVAKIAATPFAKGGSFMVPGGVNSRDNQMIPLALSGGERVDITPSGQARGGGRPREVILNGIGPRDFFTGDMLRGLVDALNQGERDGYRLKFAER
jgi:hypothetical protein